LRQQVEACVAVAKTAPLPPRGLGATRGDHENEVVGGKVSNNKTSRLASPWRGDNRATLFPGPRVSVEWEGAADDVASSRNSTTSCKFSKPIYDIERL
jgi:hypothetical protein